MAKRKRFFANTIADKIIELINSVDELNHIQTVSKGDLTTLPTDESLNNPEFVKMFFPAILVCPEDIYTTVANGNKSISSSQYYFTLRYLRHFGDNDYTNVLESSLNDAELLADALLEDGDLQEVNNILIEDANIGSDLIVLRNPCTFNINELIKIGNQTLRIENKEIQTDKTLLTLNASLGNPQMSGDAVSRVASPELSNYIELTDSTGTPVGQILRTDVPHIGVDTIEQEIFFRSREFPVVMVNIEYIVVFRSYYIK